jgi:hypothetical protein
LEVNDNKPKRTEEEVLRLWEAYTSLPDEMMKAVDMVAEYEQQLRDENKLLRDRLDQLTELAEIITSYDPDDYAIEEHAAAIRSWARIANMIINKKSAPASDNLSSAE